MYHKHPVYDTDLHLVINPVTRSIENTSGKTVLMQNDHNSERFTFEIPRYIDGHDMSTCNVVEFHYINIDSANKENQSADVYPVTDLMVSPGSEDAVIGSWLISRNATTYCGSLSFIVRFACVDEQTSVITYQWFTDIYKGFKVSQGIYNTDVVVSEYDSDTLAAWKKEIFDTVGPYVESAKEASDIAVESAANAKASEEAAAISESNAAISAANALTSEQNAKQSEINAKASEEISTENAETTQFHHDQAKALNEASVQMLEEANTTMEGLSHKIENTIFDINFETGNLECVSPNYTFDINEETGNLEGDVSDLGNQINNHIDEKVDAEFDYVKSSVDKANEAVEQLEKDFQIYVGDSGVVAELQNEIKELATDTDDKFEAMTQDTADKFEAMTQDTADKFEDVNEDILALAANMPELMSEVSSTFTKNADGTMTTTYDDGRSEVFQKNPDGSLQTTFYYNGMVVKTQVTRINSDGTIRTEITKGGAE